MPVAKNAPHTEIGAPNGSGSSAADGPLSWGGFIDDFEYVPEWTWPSSVNTAHTMRSDSQVDSLHLGTTSAIRDMRWSIDPNGAPASLVERFAEDVGLPIRGHEDEHIPITAYRFDFDNFLTDALLAPIYGHMYFETVGEINDAATEWRLRKLSPRHPRTIAEINTGRDGGLRYIKQNIAGVGAGLGGVPAPIPVERLVAFIWRQEARSWVGRSMLRSMYREWLVKDRTIRVAAVNLERAGGVPIIEGPEGASDVQLRELAQMARQFKVSEGGGGAIPFGSKLHLAGANAPSAIELLRYCDEAMARVWALMLIQLGSTQTGSRALGGEFTSYAGRAQRSIAQWVANVFTRHVILDYVEYNDADARFAPRLHVEPARPDSASTDELVALIDAGALTVDPELEAWLRNERGLPVKPEGLPAAGSPELEPDPPAPVVVAPEAVEAMGVAAARRRETVRAANTLVGVTAIGRQQAREARYVNASLPDRALRREPNEQEIRAAVDFRALDDAHAAALKTVQSLYLDDVIPAQIRALGDQVITTKAGTPRKRLTRAAMAKLGAPEGGRDALTDLLAEAARAGAAQAVAEIAEQGRSVVMPSEDELRAAVTDQADAVTTMAANGISLSAQRKASQLVGGGRTPEQAAAELEAHLSGMAHKWTTDQLHGAVQQAQNAGRFQVFAAMGAGVALTAYASEILDTNTCGPCADIDGHDFESVQDALLVYASGGYVGCEGGPRCRGTAVVVLDEE